MPAPARPLWLALGVGAALGAAATFGACTPPAAACSADSCAGCCTESGRCVQGDVATRCGRGGLACESCGDGNTCTEQRCVAPPPQVDGGAGGGAGACTPGFKPVTGATLVGAPQALVGARNLALADLDGDGKVDAVAALSGTGQGYVLRGNGDGTFFQAASISTGATPVGVGIARFDGDARLDVVFVSKNAPAVLLLQQTDAGFVAAPSPAPTHASAMGVAVADVDNDGHPDLVVPVSDPTTGDVWVNLGVGDGTFGAAAALGAAQPVVFTEVGDLDGDGRLDFASARYGVDLLGVVRHGPGGEFLPERTYPTGRGPLAVALGLLDADARPDAVVVNAVGATLTVRPNNGDGTFPVAATRATTSHPGTVAIGDLNGDAIPDVVVGGDQLDVFLGLGGGNLGIPTVFPAPASSVALADVDGNGALDIVVLSPARLTTYLRGCW